MSCLNKNEYTLTLEIDNRLCLERIRGQGMILLLFLGYDFGL